MDGGNEGEGERKGKREGRVGDRRRIIIDSSIRKGMESGRANEGTFCREEKGRPGGGGLSDETWREGKANGEVEIKGKRGI